MVAIGHLGKITLVRIDAREPVRSRWYVGTGGNAQGITARDEFFAVPHRRPQGTIERTQLVAIDFERGLDIVDARIEGHVDGFTDDRAVPVEQTEVVLPGVLDVDRGEESGVEVARGKAPVAAFILAHDIRDVIGARGACGPADTRQAVIVGSDCQGPVAGDRVVVLQQTRGGDTGGKRIHAFVDDIVDSHEALACGARELPHPGGTDAGVGVGVERRLDMRQRGDLGRQPHVGQRAADMRLPRARTDHAPTEAVGLAELEAYLVGGLAQRGVVDVVGEQCQDAAGLVRQVLPLAAGKLLQNRLVMLTALADSGAALVPRAPRLQVHHFVDHIQVAAVVQQARFAVDLRIHLGPERHGGLELGRPRQLAGGGGRGEEDRDDKGKRGKGATHDAVTHGFGSSDVDPWGHADGQP